MGVKFNYPQRVCTVVYGVGYSPSLFYYILLLTLITSYYEVLAGLYLFVSVYTLILFVAVLFVLIFFMTLWIPPALRADT